MKTVLAILLLLSAWLPSHNVLAADAHTYADSHADNDAANYAKNHDGQAAQSTYQSDAALQQASTVDGSDQHTLSIQEQLKQYLFSAARYGDNEMLREFIDAGYDLNTRDSKGYTALILSAYNGHKDTVELLMSAGADVCAKDNRGNTALMGAIFKGEVRIAKILMSAECSVNAANHAGQTPAMYAALFKRAEILESLREKGADLNAQDQFGNQVSNLEKGDIKTRLP